MSTPRLLAPRSMGTPIILIFLLITGYLLLVESVPGEMAVPRLRRQIGPRALRSRDVGLLYLLRIYPINHPGEGDDLANVLGPADPGHRALQAHTKSTVRHTAVPPPIQ